MAATPQAGKAYVQVPSGLPTVDPPTVKTEEVEQVAAWLMAADLRTMAHLQNRLAQEGVELVLGLTEVVEVR